MMTKNTRKFKWRMFEVVVARGCVALLFSKRLESLTAPPSCAFSGVVVVL